MTKQLYVTDIPAYFTKTFQSSFFLSDISRQETKESGKPFYKVRLQDSSGIVHGTIWQENMSEGHEKLIGKVVDVKALVTQNADRAYHLIIREMKESIDYEMSDYIDGLTEEESEKYLGLLWKYADSIKDVSLRQLVQKIYKDIDGIEKFPATASRHHNFSGGFLVYIISVTCMAKYMQLSLSQYNQTPALNLPYNSDLIIAGALLHAVGTIHMVTPAPEIRRVSDSIPLTMHELTIMHIQKAICGMDDKPKDEAFRLLFHIIGCVYENNTRKPILREALILRSAIKLHDKIALLEHFMAKNMGKEGIIFDDVLGNYIYLQKEDTHEQDIFRE